MKKQNKNLTIGFFISVALFSAVLLVLNVGNDRSLLGRISRWVAGESTIDQYANDLGKDIQTNPKLKELQPWAIATLARAQKGQLHTNNTPYFWRVENSVAMAPSETPPFINELWGFTNKSSGWVLPEISVVLSNEVPICVVIDFSSYGVAVGSPEYHISFDADKISRILPGVYIYEYFE